MKKKCLRAAEIFSSENYPGRSCLDNAEYFFLQTPLWNKPHRGSFHFHGSFQQKEKGGLYTLYPALEAIHRHPSILCHFPVLKALNVAPHCRYCPSWALAWQLSSLKFIGVGVWEEIAIRQDHRLCRERDEPELWPWGDGVHRVIFIPSWITHFLSPVLSAPPGESRQAPLWGHTGKPSTQADCSASASRLPPRTRPMSPAAASKCPPPCSRDAGILLSWLQVFWGIRSRFWPPTRIPCASSLFPRLEKPHPLRVLICSHVWNLSNVVWKGYR